MPEMKVFPVMSTPKGAPSFADTWGAPRSGGRTHQGTDILADKGTPVLAVDDGAVKFGMDPLGGNIASLVAQDQTRYYYAHLHAHAGDARTVQSGEIIGYVGNTGNASQTVPHLHFEVHPNGGVAINPYPLLREAPVVSGRPPSALATAAATPVGGLFKYGLIVVGGFLGGFAATWWFRKRTR